MLKEPISESLLCLCALGLVHSDATLAAAALTELLKQDSTSGSVVEQQCLLTCSLLALQGNYIAVQREASRAVHRYDVCRISIIIRFQCKRKKNNNSASQNMHFVEGQIFPTIFYVYIN